MGSNNKNNNSNKKNTKSKADSQKKLPDNQVSKKPNPKKEADSKSLEKKQETNQSNEILLDSEKSLKVNNNIDTKPTPDDDKTVVMEDVFSDSSMKVGKKPNRFKKSRVYKKWKSLENWKRITLIVVTALVFIVAIICAIAFGVLNGFRGEKLDKDKLGISDSGAYGKSGYVNIAVFGLDTRSSESFEGRSDSIIIASINKKTGSIKLTSILRDSYVQIEGHPSQKITHAYVLGGPELAIKTINQNYNMNIQDYVTFNFAKLAGLIDLAGGVNIEITEAERREINRAGSYEDKNYKNIKSPGEAHLNGMQAVLYSRIRILDSDIERTNRQRKVIVGLIDNVKAMGLKNYNDFIKEAMNFCETSLSSSEIISFSSMLSKELNIETLVIPGENTNARGGMYKGAWVWRYDLAIASNEIHRFIYGSEATTVATSPTTFEIEERTTKKTTTTTQSSTTQEQSTSETQPTTDITTGTTTESSTGSTTSTTTTKPVISLPTFDFFDY